MKKLFSVMLALLICALCIVPAFAADPDPETCKHKWSWEIDTAPGCNTTGTKHQVCSVCHATKDEGTEIPPTYDHVWRTVTDLEPTCGASGAQHQVCTVCGTTYGEGTPIPATGAHVWSAQPTEVHAPEKCMDGYRRFTCENCGAIRDESIPAAQAHNWVWVEDTPAGALTAGSKHQVCTECGEVQNMNTSIKPTFTNRGLDDVILEAIDNFVASINRLIEQIKSLFKPAA